MTTAYPMDKKNANGTSRDDMHLGSKAHELFGKGVANMLNDWANAQAHSQATINSTTYGNEAIDSKDLIEPLAPGFRQF